ncbi:MAG: alpha-2-macroglobulin family protein [Acidihalobacter sp.]|uniref:alpha-2-macroglobulin family protein n=1 Tax=Acidihalobacter sp. TaxID=1872108 RepID=UPI00307DBE3E
MSTRIVFTFLCALLLCWPLPSVSATAPTAAPAQPAGAVMVPDHFLRRWDPVTLFFSRDLGPAKGGPENHPQRFVTVTPAQPGAYTWLNAHTLQFRPAEPWPPLTRFHWRFDGHGQTLSTLFAPPISSLPANGASGLAPFDSITLTFAEPVDVAALARMISVELRPYPGVGGVGAHRLDPGDYDIKPLARSKPSDSARYVIEFHQPIPQGTRVNVHMRLSLDDRADSSFYDIGFATETPFQATAVGCGRRDYPLTRKGTRYGREQALRCPDGRRAVDLVFSARPQAIDPVLGRNLVRFTPTVAGLRYVNAGDKLTITGDFKDDTLYRVDVEPGTLKDERGRALAMDGPSKLYLYFPKRADFLRWKTSQGIVERYGPQMVPVEGRGFRRLDLRIDRIAPLNRSYWPFPDRPVVVDESRLPPGPGERPAPWDNNNFNIPYSTLKTQLSTLGSPSVSTLVKLPLRRDGHSARFGLDLKPYLARISGKDAPGTYLVGIRQLNGSSERAWIRVQVTDLALSTVDESDRVRFVVTSLRSGRPVAGAEIVIQGSRKGHWTTLASGISNANGEFSWPAPGWGTNASIHRIVVRKGNDVLVLDPSRPPPVFEHGHWTADGASWLQWTLGDLRLRRPQNTQACHTFTDRPVYKPDAAVHIKGYVREVRAGEIGAAHGAGTLVVDGPGDKEWRYKLKLTGAGSFYHLFDEKKLPTGRYQAYFQNDAGRCAPVSFRKEAYRLPRFEVNLNGPVVASLDRPFKVLMNARYYAGGVAAGRPVRWRVTQFPYNWSPKKRPGYLYSTDARFSGQGVFHSTPVLNKTATSDKHGMAELDLDPTIEPTAQPRRYVIESTVTGADDQTVTNTREVKVLPAFVLGMKLARYLPKATQIKPEIIAVGPDGKLLKGQKIRLRLLHRQWHSHLQASDFTQGDAHYVTDVVDKEIYRHTYLSGTKPIQPRLPIHEAGVYVVEITSQDRLGRSQVLRVDLFAGGAQAVTWSRPPTRVFSVATDKHNYAVGETAKLILESPFQEAHALAVVEQPDGHNLYRWLAVHHGSAVFKLKIRGDYLPRVPVHYLLMRGRVPEKDAAPRSDTLDLGKPATLATTKWVTVSPRDHRVEADLSYPHQALPGSKITLKLHLHDYRGKPLPGEVTLWLVDQAALALGKEQRLDPLPDFIVDRGSRVKMRDTRNLTLGRLPFLELPGGGGGAKQRASLLDKVTIRKDFRPVPYYNPAIEVGPDGNATVHLTLPDNLTNFRLRAKMVSGADRFGYAKGMLEVRLPVIVQPSLPHFVRPGDHFIAAAIGRVVEGKGGPGRASIRVKGLKLAGPTDQSFDWQTGQPQRIDYRVSVPTLAYGADGKPKSNKVSVTLGVERSADRARDAFSVKLPIRSDRRPMIQREIKTLKPGESITLTAVDGPVRPGTLHRLVQISDQPALVRMAAGISYLMQYPYGCTEQRISRARVMLASRKLDALLGQTTNDHERERVVKQTLHWIGGVVGDDGLAAFWPGGRGYVSLTAWSVEFMIQARRAGFQIDDKLFGRMTDALRQALRSDYGHFVDGAAYAERVMALSALADAGKLDSAYAAELARHARYLDLESTAQLTRVLARSNSAEPQTIAALDRKLWDGIVTRLYHGRKIYGGLQPTAQTTPAEILPSETRTVSAVLRAVEVSEPNDAKRKQLLLDALTTLGRGNGWGSTNADAAALLALSEYLTAGSGGPAEPTTLTLNGHQKIVQVGGKTPLVRVDTVGAGAIRVRNDGSRPLAVRAVTRYLPKQPGSETPALAQGFVVNRELLRVAADDGVPAAHIKLDRPGRTLKFRVGDVIEQHVTLVNPEERHYVAVVVPIAAGMEPLNPALATAPPEARPSGRLTLTPTYVAYLDDHMAYYYDSLPKGTYDFYFRTRATIPGRYSEPAAYAQMMYRDATYGNGNGAQVVIEPATK